MGFADLHIHSIYSYDGTSSISAILKYVADCTDLDVIAITDHDAIDGGKEAVQLAPAYGVQVIPGCEISTVDGHLLALFIDRPIQAGLSLAQTALRIGEQGGICIAAHPMARGTSSLRFDTIQSALRQPGVDKVLLGIEAFNGGLVYTRRNPQVEENARRLPLAQIGDSDAHVLQMIGQGSTEFDGNSIRDLRIAITQCATRTRKGIGLNGLGLIRSYLPNYLLRKLGWVAYNDNPNSPLTYTRMVRAMGQHMALPVH